MESIKITAGAIENINYLYKHLLDDPKNNPTNVPKINPLGTEITEIKEISALLGVDKKVASIFVMQDPNASESLKMQAKSNLSLGMYVASDDAYLPVTTKASTILTNTQLVEEKRVRMVRTVAGARRFGQKQGTIIVNDGEAPLDALTALKNDVPGYEKVGGKDGSVYYVGRENGEWVARDPLNGSILYKGKNEEETYGWLNKHAGGSGAESDDKEPTAASRVLGRTANSSTRLVDEVEAARDEKLTAEQAYQVNKLTNEELDIYQRLKQRGIAHDTALQLALTLKPKAGKKKKK